MSQIVEFDATAGGLPELNCLPDLLQSLIERRYLSEFDIAQWTCSFEGLPTEIALGEVVALGRACAGQAPSMATVLSAWHDPGQAVIAVVHGSAATGVRRHHLLYGSRRLSGGAAADEFRESQADSLSAHFPGAELTAPLALGEYTDLWKFLRTAPALAAMTGIPAVADAAAQGGLERLVRSIGARDYAVMIVAEPLPATSADAALDACRRLQSDISTFTSRQYSQTRGETETRDETHAPLPGGAVHRIPSYLQQSAYYVSAATHQPIVAALVLAASMVAEVHQQTPTGPTVRESKTTSRSSSASVTLVDAVARSCEQMLDQHSLRIRSGRGWGWWKVATYIAAENQSALQVVARSLRAVGAGNATGLDPLRVIQLPTAALRDAILGGRLINLRPIVAAPPHPLGRDYDAAATCMTSQELATFVAPPRSEISGIRISDRGEFGVTLPVPQDEHIELGRVRDAAGREHGPAPITARAFNEHVLVVGTPGSGKTNTCMQLLLAAHDKFRIPFLVIEPAKAEYRRLRRRLGDRLKVYSMSGHSGELLRVNPLQPVSGAPFIGHIDLLKAVFNASFALYPGMPQILEQALIEVYQDRGWNLATEKNPDFAACADAMDASVLVPRLQDLYEQIENVMERKGYAGEVRMNMGAALRSRLNGLMLGTKGQSLNVRRALTDDELFNQPVVIELQHLRDDEEKAFVMSILFMRLYQYCEVRQRLLPPHRQERLQHVTLIEEAHRLLAADREGADGGRAQARAVGMFTDMLAELRALGEGFIIAEQIPTKLSPDALKNTNLKIIHRLTTLGEREAVGRSAHLGDAQIQHLLTLSKGLAVVHGLSTGPDAPVNEAVLVQVHRAKDTDSTHSLDVHSSAAPKSMHWQHGGCRSCEAPCEHFQQVERDLPMDDARNWVHHFGQTVLGNAPERAWQLWTKWRKRCVAKRYSAGDEYCWFVHAVRRWLSSVLTLHGMDECTPPRLTPARRVTVEQLAANFGQLARTWLAETALTPPAQSAFAVLAARLCEALQHDSPPDLPGCEGCPAQCRMLPYVASIDRAQAKVLIAQAMPRAGNDAFGNPPSVRMQWNRVLGALGEFERFLEPPAGVDLNVWSRDLKYCVLSTADLPAEAALHRDELLSTIAEIRGAQ